MSSISKTGKECVEMDLRAAREAQSGWDNDIKKELEAALLKKYEADEALKADMVRRSEKVKDMKSNHRNTVEHLKKTFEEIKQKIKRKWSADAPFEVLFKGLMYEILYSHPEWWKGHMNIDLRYEPAQHYWYLSYLAWVVALDEDVESETEAGGVPPVRASKNKKRGKKSKKKREKKSKKKRKNKSKKKRKNKSRRRKFKILF